MVKKHYFAFLFINILFTNSCGSFGAGTHGSIKSYSYPVKKAILEQAVEKVIANNTNIIRDDTIQRNFIIDVTNKRHDTLFHHQVKSYVDIAVVHGGEKNDYTFQYSGTQEDWDTERISNISIAYAHDKDGNGGSEGHGDFPWYKYNLRSRLVSVFEQELINKIDSVLNTHHQEE